MPLLFAPGLHRMYLVLWRAAPPLRRRRCHGYTYRQPWCKSHRSPLCLGYMAGSTSYTRLVNMLSFYSVLVSGPPKSTAAAPPTPSVAAHHPAAPAPRRRGTHPTPSQPSSSTASSPFGPAARASPSLARSSSHARATKPPPAPPRASLASAHLGAAAARTRTRPSNASPTPWPPPAAESRPL